jgi:hypothetical protein
MIRAHSLHERAPDLGVASDSGFGIGGDVRLIWAASDHVRLVHCCASAALRSDSFQIASHANIGLTLVRVLALITNKRPPETTATMSSSGLRGPRIWGRAISNSFKQGSRS